MAPKRYLKDVLADVVLKVTENGLSISRAAQKYGIPKSTLHDHINTNMEITTNQIQLGSWLSK